MHDLPLTQAAGLIGLASPLGPQLLAMVSHGDDKIELPLLWRLCTAMTELGYAVTVLDATKTESEANPGLQQLLDSRFGAGHHDSEIHSNESADWVVVPSAQAIHNLCQRQPTSHSKRLQILQCIGQLFPANGVIVLYAGVDAMVQMLGGTGCRPLLTLAQDKVSLLTSYLALKRLLLKAGLAPEVLNMMAEPGTEDTSASANVAGNLSECARNFLDYTVTAIHINPHQQEDALGAEMRRLSLRMLEHATVLGTPPAPTLQPLSHPGRSH